MPSNPSQITAYAAWDQFGRPTAGSRTDPSGRATIAIVYDDMARTMTTTVVNAMGNGATMTFVDKETFDVNGNVVLFEMKSSAGTSTTTNTFHQLGVTCHGPITPPILTQPA